MLDVRQFLQLKYVLAPQQFKTYQNSILFLFFFACDFEFREILDSNQKLENEYLTKFLTEVRQQTTAAKVKLHDFTQLYHKLTIQFKVEFNFHAFNTEMLAKKHKHQENMKQFKRQIYDTAIQLIVRETLKMNDQKFLEIFSEGEAEKIQLKATKAMEKMEEDKEIAELWQIYK